MTKRSKKEPQEKQKQKKWVRLRRWLRFVNYFLPIISVGITVLIAVWTNRTNLMISNMTNDTTYAISMNEQFESRFRYIADLMVNNIGTDQADVIIELSKSLIADFRDEDSEKAEELQQLLNAFIEDNNKYWANRTNNFQRYAADCFSDDRAVREQGITNMLNNFDVRNINACIKAMLDVALLNENAESSVKLLGFANFSYFLTRYTNVGIYLQYSSNDENLQLLLEMIKKYGGVQATRDVEFFETLLHGY